MRPRWPAVPLNLLAGGRAEQAPARAEPVATFMPHCADDRASFSVPARCLLSQICYYMCTGIFILDKSGINHSSVGACAHAAREEQRESLFVGLTCRARAPDGAAAPREVASRRDGRLDEGLQAGTQVPPGRGASTAHPRRRGSGGF